METQSELRASVENAIAFHKQGNAAAALSIYRDVLSARPDLPGIRTLAAQALCATASGEGAKEALEEAISLDAAAPEPHIKLGLLASDAGDHERAMACFREAKRLRPDNAGVHYYLANSLLRLGRVEEAEHSFREAIRLRPDFVDAYLNLGHSFIESGRMAEAEACFRSALQLQPDNPAAHNNLGMICHVLGRFGEAEACFRESLRLRPDHPAALCNLGTQLQLTGELATAEACFRRALELEPASAQAHYNLALLCLLTGRLDEGWAEYEWRWEIRGQGLSARRNFQQPLWNGESVGERVVLLHAEQGFGDTLQFCRYVPLAAERVRVILEVPRPLVKLLSGMPGIEQIIALGDPLPNFDYHCPLLSLPRAFRTTLDTIPAATPYLAADPAREAYWRSRLSNLEGLRVGLVWAGNPRRHSVALAMADRRRSISLRHLEPLGTIPGVSFVSLQKGDASAEVEPLRASMIVHDWTDELDDFAETAALISGLDLVISVDTAVLHLAAALGKPVWLLNRFDTCWRWLLGRDDSPWYPSLRQFRQTEMGDWGTIIGDVKEALHRVVADGRTAGSC